MDVAVKFSVRRHELLNMCLNVFQDHQYALDPVMVKEKWFESQEKMEQLRRVLRNAKDRERRQRDSELLVRGFKEKQDADRGTGAKAGFLLWLVDLSQIQM